MRAAGFTSRSDAGDPDVRLRLWDREFEGGGPGGGGGSGIPGSHRFWLGERSATRGTDPVIPIPPVEAARRAAGAITDGSRFASGARAIAWAVFSCKASMALMGDAILVAFTLEVTDDSNLSAALLDDDRTR